MPYLQTRLLFLDEILTKLLINKSFNESYLENSSSSKHFDQISSISIRDSRKFEIVVSKHINLTNLIDLLIVLLSLMFSFKKCCMIEFVFE